MNCTCFTLTPIAVLCIASSAIAQRADLTINSTHLRTARTVNVVPPRSYATDAETRYAILVLLDAEDRYQLDAAVANAAFLASRREIPPLIIVGLPNGRRRTHDLTPRPSTRTARENPTAGGADATSRFIIDEVLPLVRSKYRTLPTTVLAGHSFGGLFAIDVAASRPGEFTGIIAMSPALWWNESTAVTVYADSIAKSTAPLHLFATSGGLERDIDLTTRRFAARLDSIKPATLEFAYKRYPDDTHAMTPAASLVDGLRFVFRRNGSR